MPSYGYSAGWLSTMSEPRGDDLRLVVCRAKEVRCRRSDMAMFFASAFSKERSLRWPAISGYAALTHDTPVEIEIVSELLQRTKKTAAVDVRINLLAM
jgi:xanthine/CO dehydrogenase XdhC/CoxF family maturation factor